MTENVADRYRRLSSNLAQTLREVDQHRWNDPSPCEDWSALDVLRHLIETQGMIAGLVGRELAPGPAPGSDALGAWISASDQIQEQLDDPVLAREQFEGSTGPMTFEQAVGELLNLDLVLHRWDIAKATDVAAEIDEYDIEWASATMHQMGDVIRSEGVFGPALEPPPGAGAQTAFLAFAGRKDWQ